MGKGWWITIHWGWAWSWSYHLTFQTFQNKGDGKVQGGWAWSWSYSSRFQLKGWGREHHSHAHHHLWPRPSPLCFRAKRLAIAITTNPFPKKGTRQGVWSWAYPSPFLAYSRKKEGMGWYIPIQGDGHGHGHTHRFLHPPFQTEGGMVGMKALPTYPPQEYLASCLGIVVGMPRPPFPRRGTWVAGPSHCEVCHEEKAMAQHAHHPTLGLGIFKADSTLANIALKLSRHVCKPSRDGLAHLLLSKTILFLVLVSWWG